MNNDVEQLYLIAKIRGLDIDIRTLWQERYNSEVSGDTEEDLAEEYANGHIIEVIESESGMGMGDLNDIAEDMLSGVRY